MRTFTTPEVKVFTQKAQSAKNNDQNVKKNTRNGQKPVQFYVPAHIKDLSKEIPNAVIIEFSEYKTVSDFLRAKFKQFVYYFLIKTDQIEKIPEYDQKKILLLLEKNKNTPFTRTEDISSEYLSLIIGI